MFWHIGEAIVVPFVVPMNSKQISGVGNAAIDVV